MKIISVRSTVEDGHYRAGRRIPFEGAEFEFDEFSDLEREERAAKNLVNAEDLKAMQRDPRCAIDGYPHVTREKAMAEDAAAAKQRDVEAAKIENERRAAVAKANDAAEAKTKK